ncbi:High mobility group box domain [Macleaya cordata]|uniref:High mobility group box domain n=1 Tax=Macleaya cordata TaxID=56857 RepID=A0A200PQZ2_MACCD|nr:High mobility group box domain [Macleaya cordata]
MKGAKSKASTAKKPDNKLSVKRKAPVNDRAGKKPAKKEKPVKDPNKPKRPASAFFVFMEEFRKTFKEKHPNNKSVSVVGKAGGDKWKSMSDAEKAPFVAKAEKRKTEYNKTMQAYNKKLAEGANTADDEDESDKSKSEVNDEDDEEDESEEEEDEDDE